MKYMQVLLILLSMSAGCQAAIVSGTGTGTVTHAAAGNVFGLAVNDEISLSVTFDNSALTGSGAESVSFGAGSGNSMDFTVGTMTFTEAMDTAGGLGPQLAFFNGSLSEITYSTTFGTFGVFFSFISFFEGTDDASNAIGGEWDLASFPGAFTVVPLPGTAALLLVGSLPFFATRRRASHQ